ncbi:MAG: lysophospholipid acyltransferase family protein [Gemmatimonadales bacterium]|nr:lysophospholipid acyltransferase family protein [Gemmatimonadales bacterium]
MKLRISPSVAQAIGGPLISALARTWRVETVHEERWRPLYEARQPHLFMCWHECLLPLLWRHRRQSIVIVVSEARDGQYLADFAGRLGYRLVRGSSSRGATRALLGAVRELKAGRVVAFTPDGPRGPRRELKPGVVAAAQRGGGTIVPLHASTDRAWRLRSWDRFVVPKPFARVRVTYGVPFTVTPGQAGIEAGCRVANAALDELTRTAGWHDEADVMPTG